MLKMKSSTLDHFFVRFKIRPFSILGINYILDRCDQCTQDYLIALQHQESPDHNIKYTAPNLTVIDRSTEERPPEVGRKFTAYGEIDRNGRAKRFECQ